MFKSTYIYIKQVIVNVGEKYQDIKLKDMNANT